MSALSSSIGNGHQLSRVRALRRWLGVPNCYGKMGCTHLPRWRNREAYLQSCWDCMPLFIGHSRGGTWERIGPVFWFREMLSNMLHSLGCWIAPSSHSANAETLKPRNSDERSANT